MFQDRINIMSTKKAQDYLDYQRMDELDRQSYKEVLIRQNQDNMERKRILDKEMKKILQQKKEQEKERDTSMMMTLSPTGRSKWGSTMSSKLTLDIEDISNPFIEKADLVNHKNRIKAIDKQKEMI